MAANRLTGGGVGVCERPTGRSGCENTPATVCLDSTSLASDGRAKMGVPIKRIFMIGQAISGQQSAISFQQAIIIH